MEFDGYNAFFKCSSFPVKSVIYAKKQLTVHMLSESSNEHCVTVELTNLMDNSCNKICIISVYSPSTDNSPLDRLERPISALTPQQINNLCICTDSNAHSTLWFNNFTDYKGEDLEDILLRYNLTIANIEDYGPTLDSGRGKSHIDVTAVGTNISNSEWKILNDESFSFHKLIYFELKDIENIDNSNPQYNIKLTDWFIFNE